MATPEKKHLEIKSYSYLGVNVMVKIDYDGGFISLMENRDAVKKWVFASRKVEYMQGWENILDAMKFAIKEAEALLSKHQAAKEKELRRKEQSLARAIAGFKNEKR